MSARPTPETDAFQQQYGHLFPNWLASQFCALARRLERERDEARDTITDVLSALIAMEHEGPRLAALRVRGEHDEAREEVQRIQHWATVNGTIEMQCELTELARKCDKLAKAAKLIADEYEDRCCQFGGDPLWIKHEQGSAVENALAIINEHHHECSTNTRDGSGFSSHDLFSVGAASPC